MNLLFRVQGLSSKPKDPKPHGVLGIGFEEAGAGNSGRQQFRRVGWLGLSVSRVERLLVGFIGFRV